LTNPRSKNRWLPVYRAEGPLGALTYIGAKYDWVKVLKYEPDAKYTISQAGQPSAAVKAAAKSKADAARPKAKRKTA